MLLANIGTKIIYNGAFQAIGLEELIFLQSTADQYFSKRTENTRKVKKM